MPGLDGTGPNGLGPMTGGGFGRCNPQGIARQGYGRGRGRRGGLNFRFTEELDDNNASVSKTTDQTYASLKQQNEALESQIIEARQETAELASKIEELNILISKMQTKPQKGKTKES